LWEVRQAKAEETEKVTRETLGGEENNALLPLLASINLSGTG